MTIYHSIVIKNLIVGNTRSLWIYYCLQPLNIHIFLNWLSDIVLLIKNLFILIETEYNKDLKSKQILIYNLLKKKSVENYQIIINNIRYND
jgi:hypothetical protein